MKPVVLLLLVAAFTFVAAGITDVAYAQEEAAASGMSDGSKLIGAGIAFGVSGALYIFIATTYFKLPEHASLALLFFFLSSFLAMPLWMRLAYRMGKDKTLTISLLYMVVINMAMIPLAEEYNVVVLWSYTILFGVGFGAPPTLVRSMMADVAHDQFLRTGRNQQGILFAAVAFSGKLGSAGGHFIAGVGIDLIGFPLQLDPTQISPDLVSRLGMLSLTSFPLSLAGLYVLSLYRISRESHELAQQARAG